MKTKDIRAEFVKYFESHKHQKVESSSLIPENDPTILFTNAGMNQFKNTFIGHEKRDYKKAVSVQKCLRAGGKHNDLENVGHTARHHTFFEMLGNFSFGDYFKNEAIHYAWDFLTNTLNIPKDKMYITIFDNDDEAFDIWHKQESIPKDRIYRFGEKDNFWRMGQTGPCGPCSEIFYDLGDAVGGNPKDNVMGGEGDRFMEIWNLVFMQYFEDESGKMTPLPKPSIDTGAGVERMASVLQGQLNNYHTDIFQKIMQKAGELSQKEYIFDLSKFKEKEARQIEQSNVAFRVLADHARACSFLIADGVLPSNEGRGYVLRRIMRRAIRYGRNLTENALFSQLIPTVISEMKNPYTELDERSNLITSTVIDEEKRFLKTLDQGTELLNTHIEKLSSSEKEIDPHFVFKLYDTYGFPFDLTQLMLKENHLYFNEEKVNDLMTASQEKARQSWKGNSQKSNQGLLINASQNLTEKHGPTKFLGYKDKKSKATLLFLSDGEKEVSSLKAGEKGLVAFDQTPFYAESGGQVGDQGLFQGEKFKTEIFDCIKQNDIHFHWVQVNEGEIQIETQGELSLNETHRHQIACHHSATHLLHSALKNVLGDHVNQAGSLVEFDRLRFDFTHNAPVKKEELNKIESLVNAEIGKSINVITEIMTPDQAKEKGAQALFGEKYGDEVRVLTMGDFSMELCGGTHVKNTSELRAFKVVSETGVSAGIRRIEALSGSKAITYLMNTHSNYEKAFSDISQHINWNEELSNNPNNALLDWISKSQQQTKKLQKDLESAKGDQVNVDQLIKEAFEFQNNETSSRLVLADIQLDDRKVLSQLSDKLKNKIKSGVVVVVGKGESSHPIIVSVTKDLSKSLPAGQLLKNLAQTLGGKGGGRPDFAQGAVPQRNDLSKAFDQAKAWVSDSSK